MVNKWSSQIWKQSNLLHLIFNDCQFFTLVRNIWFLPPLVLSKWEDLAFSVCMLFEESVFIFQFLNNKMHNYALFNTFVHFNIQKLKNKHTFIQTEKAKSSHFDRTRGDKKQIFPTLVSNIINKEAYRKPPKVSRKPQGSNKNFQGRNPYNIFVAILENRCPHKFILCLTDL